MRFRTRLLLGMLIVFILALSAFVWLAYLRLRGESEAETRNVLAREARLVATALADRRLTDALADSLGRATELRVTFIAPDGAVIGDSEIAEAALPQVENHTNRPEVQAALRGETTAARRTSMTVSRELLYTATPHPDGVIRLSVSVSEVEASITRARRVLFGGAALALLVVIILSTLLVRFVPRPLSRVHETAQAIVAGDLSRRVRPRGSDEVARIGRSIDDMAEQLQRVVEDLQHEKSDLTALFEGLEDGVAVIDEDGTVVRANPAFCRWAGREAAAGQRFATLFRDPGIGNTAAEAIAGKVTSYESQLGDRTLLMSVQPYGGGALVVMRDLTELRQLEGVRRDFVANVSHELKTPLTGILGFAEPLVDGDLTPEQARQFAERIQANARRMQALTEDLLDLARVEAGAWEPDVETVRLDEVAEAAWGAILPEPQKKRVRLHTDPSAERTVSADADALNHILHNLFDNAVRHSPPDATVTIAARDRNGDVVIEIIDRGPGLGIQHRERVFERFYRVDPARDRESGGTGLGLSIVKHLVVAHGGEVGVRSVLGEGATFWFSLPHVHAASSRSEAGDPGRRSPVS